jgi:hypothetical protein
MLRGWLPFTRGCLAWGCLDPGRIARGCHARGLCCILEEPPACNCPSLRPRLSRHRGGPHVGRRREPPNKSLQRSAPSLAEHLTPCFPPSHKPTETSARLSQAGLASSPNLPPTCPQLTAGAAPPRSAPCRPPRRQLATTTPRCSSTRGAERWRSRWCGWPAPWWLPRPSSGSLRTATRPGRGLKRSARSSSTIMRCARGRWGIFHNY